MMIDKLRKDDFIFLFWQAGEGNFAWIVERKGQIFFFVVLNMGQCICRHWADDGNPFQIDIVRNVLSCLGFFEYPVYADYNTAKNNNDIVLLLKDIRCYEEILLKQNKDAQKNSENNKNNS